MMMMMRLVGWLVELRLWMDGWMDGSWDMISKVFNG